jgi:hypothetical protein
VVCKELALITNGQNKRLMLSMPPRHGKREQTTIPYPILRLERDPLFRTCVGCYNQDFANKFGRRSRAIAPCRPCPTPERSVVIASPDGPVTEMIIREGLLGLAPRQESGSPQ